MASVAGSLLADRNGALIDEIQEMLSAVNQTTPKGRRDYALLATMFNTGARVQEILDLRACNLRLGKPYQAQLTGKGRRQRCCPIWPETSQLLRRLCMEQHIELGSELRLHTEEYAHLRNDLNHHRCPGKQLMRGASYG